MIFQLEGLPPDTLPEGMKFVRDCQLGDILTTIGEIAIATTEVGEDGHLTFPTSWKIARTQLPITGRLFTYEGKYMLQGKAPMSIWDSTIVEVIG